MDIKNQLHKNYPDAVGLTMFALVNLDPLPEGGQQEGAAEKPTEVLPPPCVSQQTTEPIAVGTVMATSSRGAGKAAGPDNKKKFGSAKATGKGKHKQKAKGKGRGKVKTTSR